MINNKLKKNIFEKVALCRHFEENVYKCVSKKIIKLPVYLSSGQEFIPSTLSEIILNTLKEHSCQFQQRVDGLIVQIILLSEIGSVV